MESKEAVLQRLALIRKELKLTQDDVVNELEMSRSGLSKIENGTQEAGAIELIMFYNRKYKVPTEVVFNTNEPIIKGNVFTGNKIKGNSNTQAGGNVSSGVDQECRQQLEEMRKERDLWKDKYIALLEKHAQ